MKVHNYKIENNSEQAEGATCETCRKITLNGIGLLSGAQLKYIAFISMLIDHTNKTLLYPYLDGGIISAVSVVFDVLGRIAFRYSYICWWKDIFIRETSGSILECCLYLA